MNKLAVVSWMTNRSKFKDTEDSLKKYGFEYFIYGNEGDPWRSFGPKMRFMDKAVKELDKKYTHVLFIDAFDSICLAGEEEIMRRYYEFGDYVLFSTEKNCWPDGDKAKLYTHKSNSCWKFLNSGGYIGSRKLLACILKDNNGEKVDEDDQRYWTGIYLSGKYPIVLDTECQIFQTFSHCSLDEFEGKEGKIINKVLGTMPCVLHFNSKTDPKPYISLVESELDNRR